MVFNIWALSMFIRVSTIKGFSNTVIVKDSYYTFQNFLNMLSLERIFLEKDQFTSNYYMDTNNEKPTATPQTLIFRQDHCIATSFYSYTESRFTLLECKFQFLSIYKGGPKPRVHVRIVEQKIQFLALTGPKLTLLIATSIKNLSLGPKEKNGTSSLQITSIFPNYRHISFLERPIY